MDKTLYNRIHDELLTLLGREPKEDEIINSQNDNLIMGRVRDRIQTEEIGVLQDTIDSLSTQVEQLQNTKML